MTTAHTVPNCAASEKLAAARITDSEITMARAVEVRDILADAGIAIQRNRIPCPVHDGSKPNFSFRDNLYNCFSKCGRGGDSIDLVMRLHDIGFCDAVRHINSRVLGRGPMRRRPGAVGWKTGRRLHPKRPERARYDVWKPALDGHLDAAGDAYLYGMLLRDDPSEEKPGTKEFLDQLGDPYLREHLAEQRLDEIEGRTPAWLTSGEEL